MPLRRFLKSRLFWSLFAALLLVAAAGIYTVFSGAGASPLSNAAAVIVTPFQRAATAAWNGASGVYARFFAYDDLLAENQTLRAQIATMEQDMRDTAQVMEENENLRALLGMRRRHKDYDIEMAEIIASQTGSWGVSYTLDRGETHGVAVGNCVIVDEGMVGFITRVGTTWSEMATIIDTDMQAGAILSRTREVGVAEGDFSLMERGLLKLSYLPRSAQLLIGDTVETSGIGGMFPKGVPIGQVTEVRTEEHGITNYAVIQPAADMSRLGHVYIIKAFDVEE